MVRLASWIGIVLVFFQPGLSQSLDQEEITLMFYNVENLFDVQDDSLVSDEAFLPAGERHWTYGRFRQKLMNTYKVIAGVGEWQPPTVIALAEVENRYVLEALLRETPLHRYQYQLVHQESPDRRGIDVALLYRSDMFKVLHQEFIPVILPNRRTTRDILYVTGQLLTRDTIHLYVNHWPSRYGGTKDSEASRQAAAQTLKNHIQLLLQDRPEAMILVTGDFNDSPDDASVSFLANQLPLKNLSQYEYEGTHKHQGKWSVLDQWLVSHQWQRAGANWVIQDGRAKVYHPEWLVEEDEAYLGFRPKRTYIGFRYHPGFSDHLPVYLRLTPRF